MAGGQQVSVVHMDANGNYWREALPKNDALLKFLRFLAKNPNSDCTIELRATDNVHAEIPDLGLSPCTESQRPNGGEART